MIAKLFLCRPFPSELTMGGKVQLPSNRGARTGTSLYTAKLYTIGAKTRRLATARRA